MDFLQKKLLMSENGNDDDQRQVRPRLNEGEIIEVEGGHIIRSVGRKDRHSKVFTAKGPRDRRVRLSALTAIQFYDVQDRLGYDRPSKAVDWLIKHAKSAIDELDRFNPPSSKQYQRIPPKNNNLQDDHHQFQFSQDQMPANSRALARDRARERAKERSSNINTTAPDHTANNFSKFPQHQQQGDHNFNSNYVDQSDDILLHQKNNNGDDKSNSDQRHRTTKAQSLNVISTDDHHHDDHPAMQQNHDQVMNSIQNYVNLPGSVTNQVADLRLSLMQRPALQYLSFLQNPTTTNCLNMMMIRPGPSGMHHRLMRPVQTFSPSSGFDPSTSSHHHQQYPGLGISAAHRHDNNYNDNSTNNVVLQSDHHHDPGLHRHQYNFFNSGSHIDSAALHASAFELHHDQSSAYTTTSAFPAVRGTLQSIGGSAAAPARARSHPSSISAVINNSNNNHSAPAGNNIEQNHDRTCNSIEETAGAFPALIPGFAGDHESHEQNDVKPSTC